MWHGSLAGALFFGLQCTQMCGGGFQFRTVTCVGGRACPHLKPPDEQQCNEQSCSSPQDAAETSLLPSSSSHTDSSSSSISSKLDGILEDVLTSRHYPNESSWQTMPKVDHTEFNSSSSLAMVTMALPSTRKPETQISGYRWVALFWSEVSRSWLIWPKNWLIWTKSWLIWPKIWLIWTKDWLIWP